MIEWSVHQKDTIIVNIYAANIGTSKYIKYIIVELKQGLKGEINNNKLIVVKFNTPF